MPAENNKSSQPAAIPVICGQKISVDFGQRKAVITLMPQTDESVCGMNDLWL